jgi:hypothetical protein
MRSTTAPTAEEFDRLAEQLLKFKPMAKFVRSLGVDPKSVDARRVCADAFRQGLEDFLKERDLERATLSKREGRP